jgi:hypothetical protein
MHRSRLSGNEHVDRPEKAYLHRIPPAVTPTNQPAHQRDR